MKFKCDCGGEKGTLKASSEYGPVYFGVGSPFNTLDNFISVPCRNIRFTCDRCETVWRAKSFVELENTMKGVGVII